LYHKPRGEVLESRTPSFEKKKKINKSQEKSKNHKNNYEKKNHEKLKQ